MRRWWSDSTEAAADVADQPMLWLPGALAWIVSVGWAALLIGLTETPSVAALTFLGARFFTSGSWPWNGVLLVVGVLTVAGLAFGMAATAEAFLLRGRRATVRDVARLAILGLGCALPVAIGLAALVAATFVVAPVEFNAPDERLDAVARTALRLSPVIVATLVAAAAGAAIHAAAGREALRGRPLDEAVRRGAAALRAAGGVALVQAGALLIARLAYLGLAALLLRVLWAPIGERLAVSGIDAAAGLLLVGFVAIWLCLVLGGGALHAWGTASWTRVLGTRTDEGTSRERMETSTGQ